jgi:hypothetical protein
MSQVTATNERNLCESPGTLAGGERSYSVAETNKESCSKISTASPSPISAHGDNRTLGRRFSYTSSSNRQVVYSRLDLLNILRNLYLLPDLSLSCNI